MRVYQTTQFANYKCINDTGILTVNRNKRHKNAHLVFYIN